MLPYPVIIGIGVVVTYLAIQAVKSARVTKPRPTTTPPSAPTPAPTAPAVGTPPPAVVVRTRPVRNWSWIGSVLRWTVVLAIIATVLFLWFKHEENKQALIARTSAVHSGRTRVFHWSMAVGDRTRDGYTESTFTADVKDDGKLFWVDLYDVRGFLVADIRLRREGGKLTGRLRNFQDGDSLVCNLSPDGVNWTGTLICRGYRNPLSCWLRYK